MKKVTDPSHGSDGNRTSAYALRSGQTRALRSMVQQLQSTLKMAATRTPSLPLSDLKQADAPWLTATLSRSGHLANGNVVSVQYDRWRQSTYSYIARLTLDYSAGATGRNGAAPPAALVLKYNRPIGVIRRNPQYAQREFIFQAYLIHAMKGVHAPRCYDAVFDARAGAYHFLLEDLSRTHVQPANPVPPALAGMSLLMERLARLHAEWWIDARLGVKIGRPFREDRTSRRTITLRKRMQKFLTQWGNRLAAPRRLALTQLTAAYPRLIERQAQGPLTLIHGDLHFGNVLLTADAADCRLIDWENWEIAPATDDLARVLAMQCFAEHRQRCEQPLLQHYHRTLGGVAHGKKQRHRWIRPTHHHSAGRHNAPCANQFFCKKHMRSDFLTN